MLKVTVEHLPNSIRDQSFVVSTVYIAEQAVFGQGERDETIAEYGVWIDRDPRVALWRNERGNLETLPVADVILVRPRLCNPKDIMDLTERVFELRMKEGILR